MLRPRATRWFEVVTTRGDLAQVMQKLAESGAVELEARPLAGARPALPQLGRFFEEFAGIEKRYRIYWPEPAPEGPTAFDDPAGFLDSALARMQAWRGRADPLIERLQALETGRAELALTAELLAATGDRLPLAELGEGGGFLARAAFFLPGAEEIVVAAGDAVVATVPTAAGVFVVALSGARDMADLRAEMAAAKAQEISLPDFEAGGDPAARVSAALERNAAERARLKDALEELGRAQGLPALLAHLAVLRWLHENRDHILATERTILVTGWARPGAGAGLRESLDETGANYVLSMAEAGPGGGPLVLDNPAWLRPFEFFPRLLGVPGHSGADPSVVTAIIAPLIFGFMFGDVGQGAVLLAAGLVLRRRLPLLGMLVPGGAVSIVFGLVFGSVFAREDIIAPLWLHPLEAPLTVLAAGLALGVVFLLLGIALDFLQSVWAGGAWGWLRRHFGLVLTYLSLLATFWLPAALWGLPLGLALTVAGAADAGGRWQVKEAAAALGEFAESLLRLFVGSVSFSRVGAFALAHGGLSAAVSGVAEAAGPAGYGVILLLGNVLIIALEGLVVGIQTTRLILFEFFTRFYRADGREFSPLALPDIRSDPNKGNAS